MATGDTSEPASTENSFGTFGSRQFWLATIFLALFAVVLRGVWWGDPVAEFDEQLYSFIGWRMTHGELPYVDWWDRKPFGLFAIFGLAHLIGGPQAIAFQLMAWAFAVTGALLVFDIARRLSGQFAGAIAGAIFLVLLSAYGSMSGQSEAFWVPMITGMVWLLADPDHPAARKRALWAMLLGGMALQVKYTVIPQCIVLGGWALWHEWRKDASPAVLAIRAALFALLGLAPTLAVALLYAAVGQFDAFWFANFVSFFDRLPAEMGRMSSERAIAAAPLLLLSVGGIYTAARFIGVYDRRLFALCWLWFLGTAATVFLPSTVYLYYFAAFSAPVAAVSAPMFDRRGPGRWVPGVFILAGLVWLVNLPESHKRSMQERVAIERMAEAIRPYVDQEEDCLWLNDAPTALYQLAGSCVPTRFVYPDHLNNALEANSIGVSQDTEVARILSGRPPVIVSASRAVTDQTPEVEARVKAALASDYTKLLVERMHGRRMFVWLRRDLAAPQD